MTNESQARKNIDPLSTISLMIVLRARGEVLARATGFVIKHGGNYYLITNWHVLSGRSTQTGQPMSSSGALPDQVTIIHHGEQLGTWTHCEEQLVGTDGSPLWLEHPDRSKVIDVVALRLRETDGGIKLYPLDLALADTDMIPQVAMPVSIVGFPLGITTEGLFPIWKTGHIASDPDLDYGWQPAFLIDATTRGGMSGSPVLLRLQGGYKTKSGKMVMAQTGFSTLFLGVYSGRVREDSEIGLVWRPHVIRDILESAE